MVVVVKALLAVVGLFGTYCAAVSAGGLWELNQGDERLSIVFTVIPSYAPFAGSLGYFLFRPRPLSGGSGFPAALVLLGTTVWLLFMVMLVGIALTT